MSNPPPPNNGNTAVITLTITNFVPNGCSSIQSPVVTTPLGSPGKPRVYQAPGFPKLYIKSQGKAPLYLQFLVVGPSDTYTVTGITFSGQMTDPTGVNTFTNPACSGNGVTVFDSFWSQPMWNYTITITNSAGVSSTIDPGVSNTDEN